MVTPITSDYHTFLSSFTKDSINPHSLPLATLSVLLLLLLFHPSLRIGDHTAHHEQTRNCHDESPISADSHSERDVGLSGDSESDVDV